jgi:hypothetical protein
MAEMKWPMVGKNYRRGDLDDGDEKDKCEGDDKKDG